MLKFKFCTEIYVNTIFWKLVKNFHSIYIQVTNGMQTSMNYKLFLSGEEIGQVLTLEEKPNLCATYHIYDGKTVHSYIKLGQFFKHYYIKYTSMTSMDTLSIYFRYTYS
jgi:hypothetical protein